MIDDLNKMDHLFRHQYGKMVSILTRIFGLNNLELIEDAIQDTFIKAMDSWRHNIPPNPEAWLTMAAKNRAIDLMRKISADLTRINKIKNGPSALSLNVLFLDHEIADSQLRMIFTACHPILHPKDQIAFALKTISGFGTKEIASAFLIKEETIKKSLFRARKTIVQNSVSFEIPDKNEIPKRINRVLEVIYLIFNEGFHSNNKNQLIKKDLCGEALRLCQILLKNEHMRLGKVYALMALLCFHSARIESKIDDQNKILDLRQQDRTKWHFPLIELGNSLMNKATTDSIYSSYHYEAAIASEHVKARTFEDTDWHKILKWYEALNQLHASDYSKMNMAIVHIQLKQYELAKEILEHIEIKKIGQRSYLLHSAWAELHKDTGDKDLAIIRLHEALKAVKNLSEKNYLEEKVKELES